MAIAFDAKGDATNNTTSTTITTVAANTFVVAFAFAYGHGFDSGSYTCTLGGTSMTAIAQGISASGSNDVNVFMFGLNNVSAGTYTQQLTHGTGTQAFISPGCASYSGVSTTTPYTQSTSTAQITASTFTMTLNLGGNSMPVAGCFEANTTISGGTGTTVRLASNNDSVQVGDAGSAVVASGNYNLNFTDGGSIVWAGCMIELLQAGGGGGTVLPFRSLQGVGI